jgi:predicted dehydrogenase
MRVAIIGAGLQCGRRAPVIKASRDDELVAIASKQPSDAEAMAHRFGCEAVPAWQDVIRRDDVDAVIVCTPPHVHAEISIAALKAGKHVLCEKPLCRTVDEAEAMMQAAHDAKRTLKCGFNHRHHSAIWEAKRRLDCGDVGRPLFARCRYGHIGRPGFENEWRADPAQAAGGQFLEQGTHVFDLFRWFLGEPAEVVCMTSRQYFTAQPLDDNGMAIVRMMSGATASLHASMTNWENLFSFEVFGDDGYVHVEGLGASYGVETLSIGKRDFTAPFQDHVIQYRGGDISWRDEWNEFVAAIREDRAPLGDARDGFEAMRLALAAYESEKSGRYVKL